MKPHRSRRTWLEEALADAQGGVAFTLMPVAIASLLRLVTSPKIFVQPTPISDTVAFVDAILAMFGVQLASLGTEWPKLRQLCLEKQLNSNDLPDGWLAAAVDQQAEHLVSFDRDFKRLLPRRRFTLLKA